MRITVDRERCIGSGLCVLTEPRVFDQSVEDGRVLLLVQPPDATAAANARRAVDLCPSQALAVVDDD